jgi:hypothetical protein
VKGMSLKFCLKEELSNEVSNRIPEDTVTTAQFKAFSYYKRTMPNKLFSIFHTFLRNMKNKKLAKPMLYRRTKVLNPKR